MASRRKKEDPFVVKPEKPKYRKLRGFSYQLEWTEDSFISEEGDGESMRLTFDFERLKTIGVFIFLALLLVLSRVFWLQIVKGDYYSAMAKGNRIRVKSIEPQRGIIYDRNGIPLVRNTANFVLYFNPGDMPKEEKAREKLIDKISRILEDEEVGKKMREKIEEIDIYSLEAFQPFMATDNISYEKALKLFLESKEMPGIVLANKSRRKYLNEFEIEDLEENTQKKKAESLSYILGYTGKISSQELGRVEADNYSSIDYIGKSGVEYTWEETLKGLKGRKRVEVDALGKEKRVISEESAQNGADIFLNIDATFQAGAERILKKYLEEKNLGKASLVALDPRNGEVLALVSLPAFDNNIFFQGFSGREFEEFFSQEDKSLFNRAIKGEYPSGSTIKPVIGAAALEEGIISENTTINSVGGIWIDQWFFPDWLAGGHGRTDIRKAIAQSVNSFFYYVGGGYEDFQGLGLDKILEYNRLFGLGEPTGIDLPSEVDGFLPSREWKKERYNESWYIGDTYHLSIGQGFLLATPLQIANFTSVFANYGTLYKPRVVRAVSLPEREKVEEVEKEIIAQDFIDEYNLEVIRQGMRQTVTYGSARSLDSMSVEVAGKTGTAQWSSKKENHAWFTCFAPYKSPEIVLTVLVEEGGEGTRISVPIAREVLEYYFDKAGENR